MVIREAPDGNQLGRRPGVSAETRTALARLADDYGDPAIKQVKLSDADWGFLAHSWRRACNSYPALSVFLELTWSWLGMTLAAMFAWAFTSAGLVAAGLPLAVVTRWATIWPDSSLESWWSALSSQRD